MISFRGNGSLWLPLGSDTINFMANFLWKRYVTRFICKQLGGSRMLHLWHEQLIDKKGWFDIVAVTVYIMYGYWSIWRTARTYFLKYCIGHVIKHHMEIYHMWGRELALKIMMTFRFSMRKLICISFFFSFPPSIIYFLASNTIF